jgi:uncharacterized protein
MICRSPDSLDEHDVQCRFADGGVWANNPVMIGLVDALVCYRLK